MSIWNGLVQEEAAGTSGPAWWHDKSLLAGLPSNNQISEESDKEEEGLPENEHDSQALQAWLLDEVSRLKWVSPLL